eukprot:g10545.t1
MTKTNFAALFLGAALTSFAGDHVANAARPGPGRNKNWRVSENGGNGDCLFISLQEQFGNVAGLLGQDDKKKLNSAKGRAELAQKLRDEVVDEMDKRSPAWWENRLQMAKFDDGEGAAMCEFLKERFPSPKDDLKACLTRNVKRGDILREQYFTKAALMEYMRLSGSPGDLPEFLLAMKLKKVRGTMWIIDEKTSKAIGKAWDEYNGRKPLQIQVAGDGFAKQDLNQWDWKDGSGVELGSSVRDNGLPIIHLVNTGGHFISAYPPPEVVAAAEAEQVVAAADAAPPRAGGKRKRENEAASSGAASSSSGTTETLADRLRHEIREAEERVKKTQRVISSLEQADDEDSALAAVAVSDKLGKAEDRVTSAKETLKNFTEVGSSLPESDKEAGSKAADSEIQEAKELLEEAQHILDYHRTSRQGKSSSSSARRS